MSTLAEIETAVPALGLLELSQLEHLVRSIRMQRERVSRPSALDLSPLDLGMVLQPLGPEDDLLEEMMDDIRD